MNVSAFRISGSVRKTVHSRAMSYAMVDIEADGPIPSDHSMVWFDTVSLESGFEWTFYATLAPISQKWILEALRVSAFNRDDTLKFAEPGAEMARLA
jgi:hypothetical protein